MSTRSTIGIIDSRGKEKRIYCHNDGYLDGVGMTLLKSWNSPDKIRELMRFGSISSLKPYPNVTVLGQPPKDTYQHRYLISIWEKNDIDPRDVGGKYYWKEEYNYTWKKGQWWVEFVDENGENRNLPLELAMLGFEGHETLVPKHSKRTYSAKKRNPLPSKKNCPIKLNFRKMI